MLAERAALEKSGRWEKDKEATKAWKEAAEANFLKHDFKDMADFAQFVFPGDTLFMGAKFINDAKFDGATFSGVARFGGAKLSGDAGFMEAKFLGAARFGQAVFKSYANFAGAGFEQDAVFVAMAGESHFTLQGATFFRVPDFKQAHFMEAPALDDLRICPIEPSGDKPDVAVRWRALKRLAVQGHDHERELLFFAEEIKALRDVRDKP